MRIPDCFKSLSTRLLLLTLIWVSFIVTSIGWTMMLNWELEASAAARYVVADLRMLVYRSAFVTQPMFEQRYLDENASRVKAKFRLLREGDDWMPLLVPRDEGFRETLAKLETQWREEVEPMLFKAKAGNDRADVVMVTNYIRALTTLSDQIEQWRANYLWQLRYLQVLLIILAIGSLFTIMFLLLRWVIRPIGRLGEGIERLSGGDLQARIDNSGEDEIGAIAKGFNHMADRLEDLYENLEQKVAEKTASVEEKNRHLAQLYEITSFFSQQRASLEELAEGFTDIIVRCAEADACLVAFADITASTANLVAAAGLPAETMRDMSVVPYDESVCRATFLESPPLRLDLAGDSRRLPRALAAAGFKVAYCFKVRSASESIGCFIAVLREERDLPAQELQLLENCAMHLGVAIENQRLIDRDRQYAVIQERQLLAQGLHDSIAQALSYLNLQVQFLSDAIREKDDGLRDESLEAIRHGVQECYEDVRELLLNFRERLHNEGFLQGVRTVIDRFEGQSHVSVRLEAKGDGPKLTPREKLQVIFIIQEALSNVRKHAQASNVKVTVRNDADLTVSIVDDGVGIDPKLVAERKGQHVGLSIMSERAARIGAQVKVERASSIGGTRVTLTLPAASRQVS